MPSTSVMTFTAIKAKDICAKAEGQIMTYLQISVSIKGQVYKTVQTSVVRLSSSPVYNEAFSFHIPLDKLIDTELCVNVINLDPNNKNVTLGKAIVGGTVKDKHSLAHWESMLDSPRKPVAQWHTIIVH